MNTTSILQQFRQAIYGALPRRADATLDMVDAITVAGHVSSPVALSEEAPFRRQFSSIYDVLTEGRIDTDALHPILAEQQPADCQIMAGYEIYALDTTPDEREEAETLAEPPVPLRRRAFALIELMRRAVAEECGIRGFPALLAGSPASGYLLATSGFRRLGEVEDAGR